MSLREYKKASFKSKSPTPDQKACEAREGLYTDINQYRRKISFIESRACLMGETEVAKALRKAEQFLVVAAGLI